MGIFKSKPVKKNDPVKEAETQEELATKDLYDDKGSVKKDKDKKKTAGIAYRVLIKPMVTEKATDLSGLNKYVFMVSDKSNKIDVDKAIQEVYGIKPTSVNIVKVKGKVVRRGRISGKRKDFKKAIVTLAKGKSISVYEGV